MKISQKKNDELYVIVSDEIMDARVKIIAILKKNPALRALQNEIDDILSNLGITAPYKAIQVFEVRKTS